jgi:hypothetical protein
LGLPNVAAYGQGEGPGRWGKAQLNPVCSAGPIQRPSG